MTSKLESKKLAVETFVIPSLEEMLAAGIHFGHQKRRWHPRIAPYLYETKGKIHIFDLIKTRDLLTSAAQDLYEVAANGEPIIFVGTKRQAANIVKTQATDCGAYFVNKRWLGGTITNFESVRQKLTRLKKIEEGLKEGGQYSSYTKKEKLDLSREREKLEEGVGGLRNLNSLPKALFVVDIKREATAVSEARKKGITVVGIVDSNCSPELIDFPITGNDDSARSIEVILRAIAGAVKAGSDEFSKRREESTEKTSTPKVEIKERKVKKPAVKKAAHKRPGRPKTKKSGK